MQASHPSSSAPVSPAASYHICAPRVAHQTIDGETVVIDFDTGAYYSTSRVGAEIWGLLAAGRTVAEIVQALAARYHASEQSIAPAVSAFLALLERETLVAPGAPSAVDAPTDLPPPASDERAGFETPTLHKYTDMADLLLLDPIHDVDDTGWPMKRA